MPTINNKDTPNMPGFYIQPSVEKTNFRRKHMLDYKNGYQMPRPFLQTLAEKEHAKQKNSHGAMSPNAMEEAAKRMQYGEWASRPRHKPMTVKEFYASLPVSETTTLNQSKYEGVVLTFDAYLRDEVAEELRGPAVGVLDQLSNTYTVRRVVIRYFMEDDTMEIREPPVLNSGLVGGPLLKRQRAKHRVQDKSDIDIHAIEVGAVLIVFGKEYHVVSADRFTQKFCLAEFGRVLHAQEESMPNDPYVKARAETKQILAELPKKASDDLWLKEKYRRFVQDDGKVLRFYCIWDDKSERFHYELHYYLVDDTVEVVAGAHNKSKTRDQPSMLLRRQILPKQVKGINDLAGTTPLGTEIDAKPPAPHMFYNWRDFKVGSVINVLNRSFMIFGADEYTQKFYVQQGYNADDYKVQEEAINVDDEHVPVAHQSSAHGNNKERVHQKNFQNMIKYSGKSFTFAAKLVTSNWMDMKRKFLLSFKLGEEMITVFEPSEKHNIGGGKVADRALVINPNTGDYYRSADFHVGAVVTVNGRTYLLESADEFTYKFMKENVQSFPYANVNLIKQKIARDDLLHLANGKTIFSLQEFEKLFIDSELNQHEILTLVRELGENGKVNIEKLTV